MNENLLPTTKGTDPRTSPMTYLVVSQVDLPDDVRQDPLIVNGIGPDYVTLRGGRGGWHRLDLSDPGTITFRYYAESKDYWQPTHHIDPRDVDLLDDAGRWIDPEAIEMPDLLGGPQGDPKISYDETAVSEPEPEPEPTDDDDTIDLQQSGGLAASALEDMGVDTTEADIPDGWEAVGPNEDRDFQARISGVGLLHLLRGEAITIDWDGNELTLHPPSVDRKAELL